MIGVMGSSEYTSMWGAGGTGAAGGVLTGDPGEMGYVLTSWGSGLKEINCLLDSYSV